MLAMKSLWHRLSCYLGQHAWKSDDEEPRAYACRHCDASGFNAGY